MKTKHPSKKSYIKKLAVYLTAVGGVIGLTGDLNATIHYSGIQNIDVDNNNDNVIIDLDNDGHKDFTIQFNKHSNHTSKTNYSFYSTKSYISISPYDSNQIIFDSPGYPDVLNKDDPVSQNQSYWKNTIGNLLYQRFTFYSGLWGTNSTHQSKGNFINQTGYIGVRFHSESCKNNSWNYGWIQFEGIADYKQNAIPGKNMHTSGKIIDWAYEDECDKPIKAGEKQSKPQSVPLLDPIGVTGLAVLLGGAGALGLRRKKEDKN